MKRYLFSSHDGYGLGHVRRNWLVAAELLRQDRHAEVTLVTGIPRLPSWLAHPRLDVVQVPPMLKDSEGQYRHSTLGFHAALAERERIFSATVRDVDPDIVIVDRHPFGTAGELKAGLLAARNSGAFIVLGLRDILDEQSVVRRELTGPDWAAVPDVYDELLVFGDPALCDHEAEYGLRLPVVYCGWVVEKHPRTPSEPDLLVVSAGGGGDGSAVFGLGLEVARIRPELRAVIAAGPYAADWGFDALCADPGLQRRIRVERDGGSTGQLLVRAGAAVQMAGYNSTAEALAAGLRPILVPRRAPRREQAIRAARLASLGLADIVDEGASASEVSWLLDQPRRLKAGACAAAGITFDGAAIAASRLGERFMARAA